MSQPSPTPSPTEPAGPSLGRLRLLAAGVCKDLMRARLTRDPTAFSEDVLGAWDVGRAALPRRDYQYLRSAADTLERLLNEFAWEHHTTSLGDPVDDTPAEVVVRGCVWLVPREGEERPDVGLRAVSEAAREGRAGEWWLRFRWGDLDDIRKGLDLLTTSDEEVVRDERRHPPKDGGPVQPTVRWDADEGELWVDGEVILKVLRKASNQRKVLDAFHNAAWTKKRVPSPFTRTGGRNILTTELADALKALNKAQQRLRFHGDGTGDGMYYEVLC